MTGSLRLLIADPAARTVETDTGTWIVAGVDAPKLAWFLRNASSLREIKRELPPMAEDAIVINVADDAGRTVHAYRSVTGSHRLYWTRRSNGEFVLTDHFRNAIAECPVEARTVPDATVVDHLLFRAPVGATGFVEEVGGLEQGEWRTWRLDDDECEAERLDSLAVETELSPSEAPGAIEATFEDLVDTEAFAGKPVNLYSGGVDSTLTQTFLRKAPMVNVGVDSPEYEFEVEYAREGAEHFRAPFEQELVDESEVLDQLEASIDATASPSCPFQVLMMNEAFGQYTDRRYVMAVGADSIFGNVPVKGPRYADWLSPLLNGRLSAALRRAAPGPAARFVSWLEELDTQLDRDPRDAQSYAHQYATYANPSYAERLFARSLVESRIAAQSDYVADRVSVDSTASRFARQAASRHMNLVFGHRVGARWRQLAMAHGNTLVNPFETRSMIETSLSVPAERRFVPGPSRFYNVSTKYLLKRLLSERLPGYPIGRQKGAGVLPYRRYRESGPLSTAFETYEPPSFVPDDQRAAVLGDDGRQSWNLLTYAVWRDRVLENPDLTHVPSTREFTWSVPRV